jgi:undecaprenyl-diphosphatase
VDWWQAVVLGIIQGITEFLPISSSGHLVLAQHFLNLEEGTGKTGGALFFDGVLHLGTLVAVLIYFRREVQQRLTVTLLGEGGESRVWPANVREFLHLGFLVAIATLPAVLVTVLMQDHIKESFGNPWMVAISFLGLGLILLLTDYLRPGRTSGPETRTVQALFIGMAQACSAVFRGFSRSGMTISAALASGLQRDWAVRFSFLMSVAASLGLAGLGMLQGVRDPEASRWLTTTFILQTLLGTLVSGIVGYLTIGPLLRLVRHARMWWFSTYLWLVGGTVLILLVMGFDRPVTR